MIVSLNKNAGRIQNKWEVVVVVSLARVLIVSCNVRGLGG